MPLADPATVTRAGVRQDQRQRILRATGELVAKRGYPAVTVELIIKRARVSFKTFYQHFPNKEACFLELFDSVAAGAREATEEALAAEPDAPWPRQVVIALHALFESILADPLIARATIVEAPAAGPVIAERYQAVMNSFSPLFALGRKFNPAAETLPATLEDTLAGGVLWSAYQRLIVGEVDRIEPLMPEAIEFVLRPYLGEADAANWAHSVEDQAGRRTPTVPE